MTVRESTMAETRTQTFENHGQYRPEYHIVVFFILLANFLWASYQLLGGLTGGAVVGFLMSIALIVMFFSVRIQILTVQDRVIRLEMRQRFREVLPADAAARANALPLRQIIALRFASDEELPALLGEIQAGQLTGAKEIKQKVRSWQADHLRA
jgi:predicted lipid-binding transport protein (Tim44 family)